MTINYSAIMNQINQQTGGAYKSKLNPDVIRAYADELHKKLDATYSDSFTGVSGQGLNNGQVSQFAFKRANQVLTNEQRLQVLEDSHLGFHAKTAKGEQDLANVLMNAVTHEIDLNWKPYQQQAGDHGKHFVDMGGIAPVVVNGECTYPEPPLSQTLSYTGGFMSRDELHTLMPAIPQVNLTHSLMSPAQSGESLPATPAVPENASHLDQRPDSEKFKLRIQVGYGS